MFGYPVRLERDDNDTVLVTFPDFPEAHTFGADEEDALSRAQDALATILDAYVKSGRKIPRPSQGEPLVPVPALTGAKLQLYEVMQRQRIGKAELAHRLRWHKPQVDRLFDVYHHSRLDQLEQALSALGKRLIVTVKDRTPTPKKRLTAAAKVKRKSSSAVG